jgi:hypothetical protein
MSFMGSVLDGLGLITAGERIKRELRERSRPAQEAAR